jgi:hypothetical protein
VLDCDLAAEHIRFLAKPFQTSELLAELAAMRG